MEIKEAIEILTQNRDITFSNWGYSENRYNGRWVRFVGQFLQVSEHKSTFDRWANSLEFELDIMRIKPKRLLREFDNLLA